MTAKFSRSGSTSPRGKRTERIDFTTDSETLAMINLLAAQADKPRSEFINEIMLVFVYGPEAVQKSYNNRIDMIASRISGQLREAE